MRGVHFRAPRVPSGSFVHVRSIPVRHGCGRVRSSAFGPFPRSLRFVGFVWVRSFHSLASLGSSDSFGCVRSIPVCPLGGRVRSCGFGLFGGRGVRSGALCPLSRALEVVVFVRVRSLHFLALWGLLGSFGCLWSIPVRPRGCSVRRSVQYRALWVSSASFGTLPCAQEVVGSFGSIPVPPGGHRCRSGAFGQFSLALVL